MGGRDVIKARQAIPNPTQETMVASSVLVPKSHLLVPRSLHLQYYSHQLS